MSKSKAQLLYAVRWAKFKNCLIQWNRTQNKHCIIMNGTVQCLFAIQSGHIVTPSHTRLSSALSLWEALLASWIDSPIRHAHSGKGWAKNMSDFTWLCESGAESGRRESIRNFCTNCTQALHFCGCSWGHSSRSAATADLPIEFQQFGVWANFYPQHLKWILLVEVTQLAWRQTCDGTRYVGTTIWFTLKYYHFIRKEEQPKPLRWCESTKEGCKSTCLGETSSKTPIDRDDGPLSSWQC